MRRGRILIFLAVILIIGLILVVVALPNILRPNTTAGGQATPSDTLNVYYASQSIAFGEQIDPARLGVRTLPRQFVTDDMFVEEAELEALKEKYAKFPLGQGTIITESMVAGKDGFVDPPAPQWATRIPVGKTAIAIPTSRLASVAYGIQDGAYVNVIACMLMVDIDPSFQTILPNHVGIITTPINTQPQQMPGISLGLATAADHPPTQGRTEVEPAFQQGIYVIPSENQRPRLVCQMILQDIKVLNLGTFEIPGKQAQQSTDPNAPTPASQESITKDKLPPDIVTLVVDPQDAVTLTYMIYANIPLNLTLRRGDDHSLMATEAATLQFLLSQYNIPVPVKLAYGLTPRLDVLALPFLPNDVVTVSPNNQGQ